MQQENLTPNPWWKTKRGWAAILGGLCAILSAVGVAPFPGGPDPAIDGLADILARLGAGSLGLGAGMLAVVSWWGERARSNK